MNTPNAASARIVPLNRSCSALGADLADRIGQRLRVHQRVFAGRRAQLDPAGAQPGRHLRGH